MKRLPALLLLLVAVTSADAGGYVYQNGYYYYGSQAYTRTQYYQPGYGCTPGYYYYSYTPVATYAPPTTVTYSADWKTQLLKVKEKQADYQAYLQALRETGMTVPYPQAGYGYGLSGYGVNATTQYGYGGTYNAYSYQQPGTIDLNLLYQQAAQLASQSQRLGGEATSNFQGLAGQAGQNQARVAEILAKGQAAAQVLAAISLPPTAETKFYSFRIAPSGGIVPDASQVPQADRNKLFEDWKTLAKEKCLRCHGAEQPKGGFNVGTYPDMTSEQKQRVVQALTTADEKKRMPRNEDGTAAPALTPAELRLWILN